MTGTLKRIVASCIALLVCGCGSCGSRDGAESDAAATSPWRAPEPWTMGAARQRGEVVLPPPCTARGDVLRAVLTRDARIASEPHTTGQLLVAEGGASKERNWQHDAAGVVTMAHGVTPVAPLPWPQRGPMLAARVDGQWLVVFDHTSGATRQLSIWRDGAIDRLGGPELKAADFSCRRGWCALLTSRLADGDRSGATAWLGAARESALGWQRVDVPPPTHQRARPLVIEAVAPNDDGDPAAGAVVGLVDELRVRFVRVGPGHPAEVLAALQAPNGALAALAGAPQTAMTVAAALDPRRCSPEAGGVAVEVNGFARVHLRSALPAIRGALHRLPRGLLATWLAPPRCDSPRRLLHAAVLTADGKPAAPVTIVGEADGYAVATSGDDVDLWLRHGASNTISWVQARCSLAKSN